MPEDVGGHLVGHGHEQGVAVLALQLARPLRLTSEDLDVDLVVGAIDPGGVVDGVGVDTAAGAGVGDAAGLGEAEVGALADHGAAQLGGQHPHRIVGLVADVAVALAGGLHIGADAAEIEQLCRRPQHRLDQFGRRQGVVLDLQRRLDLGRERYRLGRAGKDAAALGDQPRVIVGPGRGR